MDDQSWDEELYVLYPQLTKYNIPESIIKEPSTKWEVWLRDRRQRQ